MYILFFLLWIVFNGRVTTEIVIFGLVISAAIYWFMCKFHNVIKLAIKCVANFSSTSVRTY
jgi:multisubunit Na+/H+ antiporter MnhE subunit